MKFDNATFHGYARTRIESLTAEVEVRHVQSQGTSILHCLSCCACVSKRRKRSRISKCMRDWDRHVRISCQALSCQPIRRFHQLLSVVSAAQPTRYPFESRIGEQRAIRTLSLPLLTSDSLGPLLRLSCTQNRVISQRCSPRPLGTAQAQRGSDEILEARCGKTIRCG